MKMMKIVLELNVCQSCATENKIKIGSKWSHIGNCHRCGKYGPLFPVKDKQTKAEGAK